MTYPHRSGADLVSAPAALADYDDVLLSVRLDDAIAQVRAELPRAESQATCTLQLCSGLTVGLALLTTGRLHGAAAGWGWTAIALLGTAILSCLATLRPRLGSRGGARFGFLRWAGRTGEQVVDELLRAPATDSAEENLAKAHTVAWLAAAARRKFRAVQTAQALLLLALAAGVVAACTTGR